MKKQQENYLEKIPFKKDSINWSCADDDAVTLEIENKGVFNFITQKLFKKPKISFIHLDQMGSFIWPLIDGKTDITQIGKAVEQHFGDEASPIYPRLVKYFQILKNYGFITF